MEHEHKCSTCGRTIDGAAPGEADPSPGTIPKGRVILAHFDDYAGFWLDGSLVVAGSDEQEGGIDSATLTDVAVALSDLLGLDYQDVEITPPPSGDWHWEDEIQDMLVERGLIA